MLAHDSTLPLVLLGSNSNIHKLIELAQSCHIQVAGIIDNDYMHAGHYKGVPVIAAECDIGNFAHSHQFLCATNWTPDPAAQRNRHKRARQLALLTQHDVQLATLISPLANVSGHASVAAGTVVYAYASVEPEVSVGSHAILYDYSIVGHESTIGNNVVLQRHVLVTSLVTVQDNVYMGLCSSIGRSHVCVSSGTFVHPHIMLLRGTGANEVISLAARKAYAQHVIQ